MQNNFTKSVIEQAALNWVKDLVYTVAFGSDIAPEEAKAERMDYGEVVLSGRLIAALERINPTVPTDALEEASRKVTRLASPSLPVKKTRLTGWIYHEI